MIKISKKFLLVGILLLTGCNASNDQSTKWNKNRVDYLDSILTSKKISVSEETYVNNYKISVKEGDYVNDGGIRGYSETVNTNSNYHFSGYSTVLKYVKDGKYATSCNGRTSEKEYTGTSIFDYLNLTSIFTKSIYGRTLSSYVSLSGVNGIIENIKEETGTNAGYTLANFDSELKYSFNFDNNDKLLYLELDVTTLYNYFFENVKNSKKVFKFEILDSVNIPNYPNFGEDVADETTSRSELAKNAESYINSVYSKLNYISESINFVKSCPFSSRIEYKYESSNEEILKSDGTYNAPESEKDIVLNAKIYIDKTYEKTVSFNLLAHKKVERTGELGTLNNPIYQGKQDFEQVEFYFIEMSEQYGDAIYIKAGDFDMLIDAGQPEDGGNVVKHLRQYVPDCRLDVLVNTHAHSDHIGGMNSVLNWSKYITYAIDFGYDREDYAMTAAVRTKVKKIADKYIAVTDALDENNGKIYITNDFYIQVLDTNHYIKPGVDINGADDNAASVAFIMTYKEHSYYFSGDLESNGENYLASTNQLKDVVLLKANHHGSPNANYTSLLNATKPEVVVVSTAMINRGNASSNAKDQVHPASKALNRFYNVNAKVYCNMTMGTIKIVSKGKGDLSVTGFGLTSPYYLNGKAITGEENKEFKYTAWASKYR